MAGKMWVRLYTEINHDAKMLRLSDRLFRRAINCFAFAGEVDKDGLLMPLDDMAFLLHVDPEHLETEFNELARLGILDQMDGNWYVTHFAERQDRAYGYSQTPSAIRKRAQREREKESNKEKEKEENKTRKEVDKNRDVTDMSRDMSRDMSHTNGKPPTLPIHLATPALMNSWGEWQQYHKDRGKPIIYGTATRQFKQFEEWGEARSIAAIEFSMKNGYVGLVEPKPAPNSNGQAEPAGFAAVREVLKEINT